MFPCLTRAALSLHRTACSTATDCSNSILQPCSKQGQGHFPSRLCRLVKETSIFHFIPNFNECLQFISKNLKMHEVLPKNMRTRMIFANKTFILLWSLNTNNTPSVQSGIIYSSYSCLNFPVYAFISFYFCFFSLAHYLWLMVCD